MTSDLNMSYGKISADFVSFPLFGFTLVIKLRNFKVIEILNLFYQKQIMSDLNMS